MVKNWKKILKTDLKIKHINMTRERSPYVWSSCFGPLVLPRESKGTARRGEGSQPRMSCWGCSCVCSQQLWSPIKHSLSCCWSSEGEPISGPNLFPGLEDGGGSAWAFAQVSSEFKCQLTQEPVLCTVPDHSPARWHFLKLFHLHPSFKGCSEGVCRQVSLSFFFTACRFTLV